jgi:hypothetical protein
VCAAGIEFATGSSDTIREMCEYFLVLLTLFDVLMRLKPMEWEEYVAHSGKKIILVFLAPLDRGDVQH